MNQDKLNDLKANSKLNKDFFHKLVFNNISIKILSFLVAIIIWTIIINIDDPYKQRTFIVEVQTVNGDALKSVNKVYEIIDGDTAKVTVKGKKSVVDKLKPSDIRATADLSHLSSVNAVAIVPKLKKNVAYEPTLECDDVLQVSLENMASKQVKVSVVTSGKPEDGYSLGECIAKPNMIEVTGGESAINKIESVRVYVNVNGVESDFVKRVKPAAYDENGEQVKSSTLSYSSSKVKVSASVLQTKFVSVNVKINGEPADGYEFVTAECLPKKIQVAGTPTKLHGLKEVTIPIDITGMKSSSNKIEQNISIQDYLGQDVTVLSEYALVSLKITIEKLEERTISIPTNKVSYENVEQGLQAKSLSSGNTFDILVRGRASILDKLLSSSYSGYIDCSGLEEGSYNLPVKFHMDGAFTIVKSGKMRVKITKSKNHSNSDETVITTPKPTSKPTQSPADDE